MPRLRTILLVTAAAGTITVITSGSAYAGDAATPVVTPVVVTSEYSTNYEDETGCGFHRSDISDQPAVVDSVKP